MKLLNAVMGAVVVAVTLSAFAASENMNAQRKYISSGMIRTLLAALLALLSVNAVAWHEWASLSSRASGRYLSVRTDGTGGLRIDGGNSSAPTRFTILDADLGKLKAGDAVFLRALDGQFMSVEPNDSSVRANAPQPLSRQKFVILTRETTPCEASRHQLCELWDYQLEHADSRLCIGADPANVAADVRLLPCTDGPATTFRLEIYPEQPPLLSLSAPFAQPAGILPFWYFGVDHRHMDGSEPANKRDCTNAAGQQTRCYGGHEGTDFVYSLGSPGKAAGGSMDVLAAAPGFVTSATDGNTDRCYARPQADDDIYCPGVPAGTYDSNTVVIVQDDGVIARYYHMKKGSIFVKAGDYVQCGAVLGKIGSSGHSAAPHLHFDMARPLFKASTVCKADNRGVVNPVPSLPEVPPGRDNNLSDFAAWHAPTCPTGVMLDPYDPAIAAPRQTLWFALGTSDIPKLTCQPSTKHGKPALPGEPGASCRSEGDCRPWLVCGSSGTCQPRRDSGNACQIDRDCAQGLHCDGRICTRRGGIIGQHCDVARHCGSAFECTNGFCALPRSSGQDGCPSNQQLRCPAQHACGNNRSGQCVHANGDSCTRVCMP